MKLMIGFVLLISCTYSFAQNGETVKGNRYYKDSAFDKAEEMYRKSLSKKPTSAAQYNLGNTLYQKQQTEEAIKSYDATSENTTDAEIKAKSLYNKGVLYHKNNQLNEAIEAYKEALLLTPNDQEIRKNLQLALIATKKQNPEQNNKPKPKEQKPKEEKKEKKEPPPQSKLTKKQAEQYLKALEQKEKQLQEKMQKKVGVPGQPEKDWK